MNPPEWLNETFLSAALESDEGRVSVIGFHCTPAVTDGNNNFSCLYRVKVKFKKENNCDIVKTVSLIVKSPVTDSFMKDLASKLHVVEKERRIYNELLPEVHRNLTDDTLTPRNYYSLRDDVLLLEDLKENGYVMCNRIDQLDYDHCLNVMKTLAKFHASSVALYEKNPDLIEDVGRKFVFIENIGREEYEKFSVIVKDSLVYTAGAVKTFHGYERFSDKILQQLDTVWDKLVTVFQGKKHIKVLNHGDLWTNNILFKYDAFGKVVNVKLVDLQLCKYATPGVDIHTFFVSSANADVRERGYTDAINAYRETFNSTLRKLNCNISLSAAEVEEEIRFADIYGFFVACSLLPVVLANPENPPKLSEKKEILENMDRNFIPSVAIYYGDKFRDVVINQLEIMEAYGVFS